MTLVLGIDPGLTAANPTGICIVNVDRMSIAYAGLCIPRAARWEARIRLVTRHVRGLLAKVRVDLVTYESPPMVENIQTLIKLASLTGAMMALAEEYDLPCVGVSPAQAKCALAGFSTATKEDQIAAARRVFGAELTKDLADAAAVALAGEAVLRRVQLVENAA